MTLISQLQNIRQFAQTQLADVIDPARHFREDDTKRSTGDQAFAVIRTPFNTYNITCSSAYVEPPAGAPLACKSLGTVTFIERATGKQIVGPKADQTWSEISAVIHKSELRDAIADARRHIAEAAPHELAGAKAKLVELAGKAKKWGILVPIPMEVTKELTMEFASEDNPVSAALADRREQIVADLQNRGLPAVGSNAILPHIGAPVVWITNPGEGIGGMTEIPGICVKVLSPDRIAMFVMPDHSEPKYMDNLMRRGSPAGNGNVHLHNCWDFNPHWLAERERVAALERKLADTDDNPSLPGRVQRLEEDLLVAHRRLNAFDLEQIYADVRRRLLTEWGSFIARIGKLEGRVIALEAAAKEKPRRGRPPKAEGEKHDPSTSAQEMEAAPAPEAEDKEAHAAADAYAAKILSKELCVEIEGAELASELDPPKETDASTSAQAA